MSHLVYGLSQQEGFIVITGEVGAGKTMLMEQLWALIDRQTYKVARIVTTQISSDDLLRLVMAGFGLEVSGTDKATLLERFENMVRDQCRQGCRCLLVIDEVQNLPFAAMEELRMLSNITVDQRAAVQTILLGQPQFRPVLASRDWKQLRQRVLASFHVGPLIDEETRGYIEHRLRTVGWDGVPSWDDDAFHSVHRHSGGIPRRINTLCSRVLLLGALENAHHISAEMVNSTAEEFDRDLGLDFAQAASASIPDSFGTNEIIRRLELLEGQVLRQEKITRQMLQLLEVRAPGGS